MPLSLTRLVLSLCKKKAKAHATACAIGILVSPQSGTRWLPFVPYHASVHLYVCRYNNVETRMIEGEDHSLVPMYER
jgi:hypothetical protein